MVYLHNSAELVNMSLMNINYITSMEGHGEIYQHVANIILKVLTDLSGS